MFSRMFSVILVFSSVCALFVVELYRYEPTEGPRVTNYYNYKIHDVIIKNITDTVIVCL